LLFTSITCENRYQKEHFVKVKSTKKEPFLLKMIENQLIALFILNQLKKTLRQLLNLIFFILKNPASSQQC
jgi:hypothetical protein